MLQSFGLAFALMSPPPEAPIPPPPPPPAAIAPAYPPARLGEPVAPPPVVRDDSARAKAAPFVPGLIEKPKPPTIWRMTDARGQAWEHTDVITLKTWVANRNATFARPVVYRAYCTTGNCPR